jgi:hypothetical protein
MRGLGLLGIATVATLADAACHGLTSSACRSVRAVVRARQPARASPAPRIQMMFGWKSRRGNKNKNIDDDDDDSDDGDSSEYSYDDDEEEDRALRQRSSPRELRLRQGASAATGAATEPEGADDAGYEDDEPGRGGYLIERRAPRANAPPGSRARPARAGRSGAYAEGFDSYDDEYARSLQAAQAAEYEVRNVYAEPIVSLSDFDYGRGGGGGGGGGAFADSARPDLNGFEIGTPQDPRMADFARSIRAEGDWRLNLYSAWLRLWGDPESVEPDDFFDAEPRSPWDQPAPWDARGPRGARSRAPVDAWGAPPPPPRRGWPGPRFESEPWQSQPARAAQRPRAPAAPPARRDAAWAYDADAAYDAYPPRAPPPLRQPRARPPPPTKADGLEPEEAASDADADAEPERARADGVDARADAGDGAARAARRAELADLDEEKQVDPRAPLPPQQQQQQQLADARRPADAQSRARARPPPPPLRAPARQQSAAGAWGAPRLPPVESVLRKLDALLVEIERTSQR